MNASVVQPDSVWPHRLALLLVGTTFPLIWVGGLVTSYDAGMAVPDWPTTYGYNMFRYPWQTWIYGPWDLFIEHGHRLLASAVGLLTIALAVSIWLGDRRLWLRWLSIGAVLAVVGQGSLGGLRVIQDKVDLARVHGCVGPAFFAFAVALEVVTSRIWTAGGPRLQVVGAAALQRLALVTLGLAYGQIVLGSFLRHVPTSAGPGFFRTVVVFHLLMALALATHVALLAVRVGRRFRGARAVLWPTVRLAVMTSLQIALGLGTWIVKYGWPNWLGSSDRMATYTVRAEGTLQVMLMTAHVAVGAMILATVLVIVLRSRRLLVDLPTGSNLPTTRMEVAA